MLPYKERRRSKRPKSAPQFVKPPTFVVAYALQETHDETKQKNPTVKRSPQTSKSVTPSISVKALNAASIQRLTYITDTSHTADANQYGDVVKLSHEIPDYIEEDKNSDGNSKTDVTVDSPNRDSNVYKSRRRYPKNCKRTAKIRSIHFKNKKNDVMSKLARYCLKVNSSTIGKFYKELYPETISKIVSLPRRLAKIEIDEVSIDNVSILSQSELSSDIDNICDMGSMTSSLSTVKRIYDSGTSQITLTRTISTHSSKVANNSNKNDDSSDVEQENKIPYRSDIINLGVAVTYNNPIINDMVNDKEAMTYKHNSESDNTLVGGPLETPKISMNRGNTYEKERCLNSYAQNKTGNELFNNTDLSTSGDTFVLSINNSEWQKSSVESSITIDYPSDIMIKTKSLDIVKTLTIAHADFNPAINESQNVSYYKQRDRKVLPELTPSTSSGGVETVVVTGDQLKKPYARTKRWKLDGKYTNIKTSFLQKRHELDNPSVGPKNFELPNETAIKKLLDEEERKGPLTENAKSNYPATLPELWDRLILMLDAAIKRLEDTLAEKIVFEIRKSLNNKEKYLYHAANFANTAPNLFTNMKEAKINLETQSFAEKNISTDDLLAKGMQCELVNNQTIDEVMLNQNSMLSPSMKSDEETVIKEPDLLQDYFKILKPPVGYSKDEEVIDVETVVTSTVQNETRAEQLGKQSGLRHFFRAPRTFIAENLFVITGVPTFFLILFMFYSMIVLIVKP